MNCESVFSGRDVSYLLHGVVVTLFMLSRMHCRPSGCTSVVKNCRNWPHLWTRSMCL